MNRLESLKFQNSFFGGVGLLLIGLSVISAGMFFLVPLGDQIQHWLRFDRWLNKDLIFFLRYLGIDPYTDLRGLNRIIEWIVSIHIFIFGFIPILFFGYLSGIFFNRSTQLEKVIKQIETHIDPEKSLDERVEDFVVSAAVYYYLDKIYMIYRRISDLSIWSPLDKVWFYFSRFIIWGFLLLLGGTFLWAILVAPYL
jgi:hypothetical protein